MNSDWFINTFSEPTRWGSRFMIHFAMLVMTAEALGIDLETYFKEKEKP